MEEDAESGESAPGYPWLLGAAIRCPQVRKWAGQGQSNLVTARATGAADVDDGPETSGGLAGSRVELGTDLSPPSTATEEAAPSSAHVQVPREYLSRGGPQVEFNEVKSI